MVHTFSSSSQEAETGGFEASLVYMKAGEFQASKDEQAKKPCFSKSKVIFLFVCFFSVWVLLRNPEPSVC